MTAMWELREGVAWRLSRPFVLAILNVTPDSFHDGGRLKDEAGVVGAAEAAARDGADGLDIGGESTRPGAACVGVEAQIARVVPAIRAIRASSGPAARLPITIDTTLAPVAAAALDAGADAINDVSAGLDDPGMLPLAAERGVGVVLMHRLAAPAKDSYSDQYATPPAYGDVVAEVAGFLRERASAAVGLGVPPARVLLDPGLGFGKTVAQNLELVRRTGEIAALGFGVMSGASRKSFVGRAAMGRDSLPAERLAGSLAVSVCHLAAGARVFRVHDVREQVGCLRAAVAVLAGGVESGASGAG